MLDLVDFYELHETKVLRCMEFRGGNGTSEGYYWFTKRSVVQDLNESMNLGVHNHFTFIQSGSIQVT